MRVVVAILSFFGSRGHSITSCGGAHDHFQSVKITVTPDPIQKGKSFVVDVLGTMDEDLSVGTVDVDLDVKVLSIIDTKLKSTVNFSFAPAIVTKGDAHLVVGPVTLPSIPLPGSIAAKGTVALKNSAGEPILCLSLDVDVPAVEEGEDAVAGVLDPAPVATCTKDSDHMRSFKVLLDKDARALDLAGTLDEDITKVSIKADLKLHIGFFPIPVRVQVPVSIAPGVKKGDLNWRFSWDHDAPASKVKTDGQVVVSDGNGEEVVCFEVTPPEVVMDVDSVAQVVV